MSPNPRRAEPAERAEPVARPAPADGSAHCARSARGAPDVAAFERALLDVAAAVEADETQIKQQILDAARAGDCGTVIDIVQKWLTEPPAEVLAGRLIDAAEAR